MEKKAPNGHKEKETIPFLEAGKDRVVPLLMLFGANASGKTNLTSAFSLYMHVLREGIRGKYFPNKLNKKYNSTTLELNFFWDNADYTHLIEYDQTHIIKEQFIRKDKTLFEINEQQITKQAIETKGYGLNEFNNILTVECSEGKNQIHSFLTKLTERLPGLNNNLSKAYQYLKIDTRVITSGESLNPAHTFEAFRSLGFSLDEAFADITHLLQLLDISLSHVELTKEEKLVPWIRPVAKDETIQMEYAPQQIKQQIFKIISFHKDINGQEIPFDFFREESLGTIRLFSIIGAFLLTLRRGGVLVWDELDASLHPCLLRELLKMFKSKRYNIKNAQLITSLHDLYILEDENIRVSDIAVLNKTLTAGSVLTRVVDFENARNDINFRRQYLQGHFRRVPNAYLWNNPSLLD